MTMSVQFNHVEALELLIKANADVNKLDEGKNVCPRKDPAHFTNLSDCFEGLNSFFEL